MTKQLQQTCLKQKNDIVQKYKNPSNKQLEKDREFVWRHWIARRNTDRISPVTYNQLKCEKNKNDKD